MNLQTIFDSNAHIIILAMLVYYILEYKSGNVSPFSFSYWGKDNIVNLVLTAACVTLWYWVLGVPDKMAALALGLIPNMAVDYIIDFKAKYSNPKV